MTLSRMMNPVTALLGAFVLLIAAACSSEKAADTGEWDKASLQAAQDEYDRYFEARDFDTIVEIGIPDKLLEEFMAEEGNRNGNKAEYRQVMAQQFDAVFSTVTITDYETDVKSAKIRTTETGRPYAFVPTVIELETQGVRVRADVDMLAIVEDGRWYFLNPADQMSINVFKRAFPDLEPLDIKPQKSTVVSQ